MTVKYFILIFLIKYTSVCGENIFSYISTTSKNDTCHSASVQCVDCHTMEFCIPSGNTFIRSLVECNLINSKNVYCDQSKNECTDNQEVCNGEINIDDSTCFGEGYLPYPLDCKKYMMCIKINDSLTGNIIDCSSSNSVYNHNNKGCMKNAPCFDFSDRSLCKNKSGRIVTYPPDESIYARCPSDTSTDLWVYKCLQPYEFNLQSGKCKPVCRSSGKIVDIEVYYKYYECVETESGFVLVSRTCPPGTVFNDTLKICNQQIRKSMKQSRPVLFSMRVPIDTIQNSKSIQEDE